MALGFAAIPAEAAKADYVALGDSYTAGTGAGAFTTAPPCVQTHSRGYADLVGGTGRVNPVANAACHGALLIQQAPGTTSVADQLAGLVGTGRLSSDTELVSVTAGANDVGFTTVLLTCAFQPQACQTAIDASAAALVPLRQGLAGTYVALRGAAPDAKIAVLGYPRLFDPAAGIPGIDPAILVALNGATDALNATIAAAVSDANVGAVFIDVRPRFRGHAANSADPWLVFDQANFLSPQNFHPNPARHSQGYAAALVSTVKPAQLARR
jgi:lysophospholipase L1-like esterase